MAATFQFSQSNGSGETKTDIGNGSGGNYFNFKNADTATPSDYTTYPITAGNCSYEVYLQGHWTGTFSSISNVKFWMSTKSLTGYGTGASIHAAVVAPASYATPSTTENADSACPESEGSALSLTYLSNYCSYVRLQLETESDASAGTGGTSTFTLKYDET